MIGGIQAEIRLGFIGRGSKNKQQISLQLEGVLNGVRVGVDPWIRWRGDFGGVVGRVRVQYPAFAPSTSETAVGF